MVYLDNAATTYPKPNSVIYAVGNSFKSYCSNPGRSGHDFSKATASLVYEVREKTADFFNSEKPENVIFTPNCTYSLNLVIKGLAKKNSHFIVSSLEHNSVIRPLEMLKNKGICTYSIAKAEKNDINTVSNFQKLIQSNTVAIICTGASNVFGKVMPVKSIAELAHKNNLKLVVDAAQTSGILDIDCKRENIDFLCVAGHKGLYAPMSVGILLNNCGEQIETLVQGGTGNDSFNRNQPDFGPERYESGTLSVPLIAGLSAGIDFVKREKVRNIYFHEMQLIDYLYSELKNMKNIVLYTNPFSKCERFVPVLSFNIKGLHSEQTADLLNREGIAVRAGYHCAPLAHISYKTEDVGTVRVAPSVYTNKKDVNLLLKSIFKFAKIQ